jgi:DNA-binding transcriptional regulator YdaS (Cro superfamily)
MDESLRWAIEAAGGARALGRALGISHQAIIGWRRCPPIRVIAIEKITGVSRHELRPDIYPPETLRHDLPATTPPHSGATLAK